MKTAERGVAFVGAMLNPVDSQTDRCPADHGQVQDSDGISDPTAVFPGGDIEPEVEAIFDSPVTAVGGGHLAQRELGGRPGSQEPFRFDFLGFHILPIDEAGQASGLLDAGKAGLFRRHVEALKTTGLQAAAIAFDLLERIGLLSPRGKRRAANPCGVAARYRQPKVGCL